jgi:HrpA-like RNA helicase
MPEQMLPEILRSELSGPILQLKAIGIDKIHELDFMDRPSDELLKRCLDLLTEIKCLKENEERITDYGLEVSKIPMAPVLSHLLISSLEFKCSGIVLSMLSILSVDNLFYGSSKEGQKDKKGNIY